jgi:hypothetical protein
VTASDPHASLDDAEVTGLDTTEVTALDDAEAIAMDQYARTV